MSVFLTVAVLIMFVLVPILKLNEKKYIERITKDAINLEIKEDTKLKTSVIYIVLGVLVVFCTPFGQQGLLVGILKILTVVGLYFMEEEMRTRYYLGEKGIYEITRFKGKLMNLRRVRNDEILKVTPVKDRELIYKIHFQETNQNKNQSINIRIEDHEDLEILKNTFEKNLSLFVERPQKENEQKANQRSKEENQYNFVNKVISKLLVATFIIVAIKEIFIVDYSSIMQFVNQQLAWLYIPMTLYLLVMTYLRTRFSVVKKSKKDFFTITAVTMTLLPLVTVAINGPIEGERFIVVQIIGLGLTSAIMFIGYLFAKMVNKVAEKNILGNMENMLDKANKEKVKAK